MVAAMWEAVAAHENKNIVEQMHTCTNTKTYDHRLQDTSRSSTTYYKSTNTIHPPLKKKIIVEPQPF